MSKTTLQELKRAAIIRFGFRLRHWVDRAFVRYSLVGNLPILDTAQFPWVAELERNWQVIREEADRVLIDREAIPPLRQISRDHYRITKDDNWRSFFLWGYGERSEENCRRCPETARLVEGIPDLQTALFSVLWPGAHIPRHRGVTRAVLTCHLGLRIPRDRTRCHIQVADQDYAWEEGRMFIFDDLYHHEVWNETDEDRVVLIVHVKRPMRFPGALIRDAFLGAIRRSPFIQDARQEIERWSKKSADRSPAER